MIDYKFDESGDLVIEGSDFAKGRCNEENQRCLLIAEKGEYKNALTKTVGLIRYLNDDSPAELLREIRLRFSDDGMNVQSIDSNLNVIADYGK